MGAYDVSRALGPSQRPFRYGDGTLHRPAWMEPAWADASDVERLWIRLVAYVANTGNESGFFEPDSEAWLYWSGLPIGLSLDFAESLKAAGALTLDDGRWYVAGWRETYRYEAIVEQLSDPGP